MVEPWVHELDDFAAELDAHPLAVDDRRFDDVLLKLARRRNAVAVAVDAVEESGTHAADATTRVRGDVDLVAVDDAVVVAVDHVAGHLRVTAVHVAQHVFVGDENRRVREDATARRMVEMAVAVDDVADGLARKARVELTLEPWREVLVDRIAEDDSGRSHEKHRVPVAVARAVEIAVDLHDLARRSSRRLRTGAEEQRRAERGAGDGRLEAHPKHPIAMRCRKYR